MHKVFLIFKFHQEGGWSWNYPLYNANYQHMTIKPVVRRARDLFKWPYVCRDIRTKSLLLFSQVVSPKQAQLSKIKLVLNSSEILFSSDPLHLQTSLMQFGHNIEKLVQVFSFEWYIHIVLLDPFCCFRLFTLVWWMFSIAWRWNSSRWEKS